MYEPVTGLRDEWQFGDVTRLSATNPRFPGAITEAPELTVLVALLNPQSRGHMTPGRIDVGLFTEPDDRARKA